MSLETIGAVVGVVLMAVGCIGIFSVRHVRARREKVIAKTIHRVLHEQRVKEQRQDIGKYDSASRLVACIQRYQRYAVLERLPTPDDLYVRLRKALK